MKLDLMACYLLLPHIDQRKEGRSFLGVWLDNRTVPKVPGLNPLDVPSGMGFLFSKDFPPARMASAISDFHCFWGRFILEEEATRGG